MTNYHTTMDAALSEACRAHPYYANALNRLRLVADPNVPTMATSATWVTHYNPKTLAEWTLAEAGAVLVHELEHLLRQHSERCGDRDHAEWNVAADAEINQRLAGLPDGAVYPSNFGCPNGQTAEVYYAVTHANKPEPEPQDGGSGDGEPQDGDGGEGGSGDPAEPAEPAEPADPAEPAGAPDCGSSAGGAPRPWEAGDKSIPAMSKAETDAIRRATAEEVMSRAPGSADTDDIREWAEAELGIDRSRWYAALAGAVGHTLASSGAPTRWRWPGRRDPRDMGGAILPRWTGERPSCAVIIDTSSSITPGDLDMARAAGHFLGRMADVTYYGCNTQPTRYGDTLPERLYGGGGTNLVRGIDMAIEDGAQTVIVITDCMTPWPAVPTQVPIIVGANAAATHYVLRDDASVSYYRPPEWITIIPIIPGA